ncbi:GyrI-like domain-containing protein [Gordonia zhaorongruii]|uniref:GyrI-like domain-containing protein n=1 Tax=Gordonia zhaorongruii TaxID=2597659 RepID=UPI00117DF0AE|nr:GyrI-like domain-containing protein [Gordonia zhaorongruii]
MTSGVPLYFGDDAFLHATEVSLPADILVATKHFPDVTLDDLPELFDESFEILAQAGPVGPAFAQYIGDPTDVFDLTIGFPVAAPTDVEDTETGLFPGGSALIMSHIGGFDGLGSAWDSLMELHFARGGAQPRATLEIYATDPSGTPQEDLRTDLIILY